MEYATLENLKTFLGVTWTENDTTLSRLITTVSKQFDNYLGRNLETATYSQYYTLCDYLIITNFWPITDVVSINKETNTGDAVTHKRVDENLIYLDEAYDWTLYVEYTAGFNALAEIPDVEQACMEAIKTVYSNTAEWGNSLWIKSEKIETLAVTYASQKEIQESIIFDSMTVLDNYKAFNPIMV